MSPLPIFYHPPTLYKLYGYLDLDLAAQHLHQYPDSPFGIGRVLDYQDMPTVRAIARDAARDNNRFSAFIRGIVGSAPFQMRSVSSTVV